MITTFHRFGVLTREKAQVNDPSHGTANAHDNVQIVLDTDVSCDGVLQALTLLCILHYCSWKVLFFPVKLPDGQPYFCLAAVVS